MNIPMDHIAELVDSRINGRIGGTGAVVKPTHDLKRLFSPRSVAVVGAAREPDKVGHLIFANLLSAGFEGNIYPVNPKADEILGVKCYKSISEIPEKIDLAVLSVPRDYIIGVAEECAQNDVGAMIVISAGFREVGPEGARLEKQLIELSRRHNLPFVGPNCLGVIHTPSKLNASFAATMPEKGSIALMSQSGAIYAAILDWAMGTGLGFSSMVSLGNKADVDEVDLLRQWGEDEDTKVIIGYMEGLSDGATFMKVASEVVKKKPVIVIKSGVTDAGAKAAASHTGTLAGAEATYIAAFNQSGVIHAASIQDLFDYAQAFSLQPVPPGDRVAILTNAGGPAIMTADACERRGLPLATISQESIEELRTFLPPAANFYNPVDILGDAGSEKYQRALDVLLKDPGVDSVIVILVPTASAEIVETAKALGELSRDNPKGKPVISSFMGMVTIEPSIPVLREYGIPNYPFPERAVEALGGMSDYRNFRKRAAEPRIVYDVDKVAAGEVIAESLEWDRRNISDIEALKIISAYGMPTPNAGLARSSDQAAKLAADIGFPVVLKVTSPDILHKSDIGAVKVGLSSETEVRQAYEEILSRSRKFIPDAQIWGVSVHQMVTKGREVIVGMTRDKSFGPVMLFGLGGIYVEVLKDVTFRVAPFGQKEAFSMIESIRAHPLLRGVRGEPSADLDIVAETILRLAQLALDFPVILEAEINPLTVYEKGSGAVAVDGRLILGE